ncbi:MAG: glutaminyl-peptide cyclotransferase [Planctomycetota bacterium]|jgi:glutamine cyclotransferase|nr:glutaminyl-peptide cyclotransferase [Blastopirellula sp.]
MTKKKSVLNQAREGKLPDRSGPGTGKAVRPAARRPMRWDLVFIFLVISIGGSWAVLAFRPGITVPVYTYRVVKTYPHDPNAFTQGLLIDPDGTVFESTGQYGESTLRKYRLETGELVKQIDLAPKYFGEGLARWGDRFYQLTWKEETCFVYDSEFNRVEEFTYDTDGWGLTSTETELVMSNGTHRLSFRDPQTFEERRYAWVRMGGRLVPRLNELEYYAGKIYANQLDSDLVFVIEPQTGSVLSVIDLAGLWPYKERQKEGSVLNGIAVMPGTKRMFVTGKYCPKIYELELIPK